MTFPKLHPRLTQHLKQLAKTSADGKIRTKDILQILNEHYIEDDAAQQRRNHAITANSTELDERFEQAKKDKLAAEAANVSKSMFLANMSHEIRTPLNGVLGFTSLLMTTELSEAQQEYLDVIHSSGKTLLFLLNDILDLSKIESGSVTLETISFSLQNVVKACVNLSRGQLTSPDVDMNTYIDPRLACAYMGDPERLTQIITNFLSNALKFTSKGSIGIEVLALPCPEGEDTHEKPFEIRISDTGIGIPDDKVDLIFKTFTQAESSTTREYGGTGLGLAISKQLATMMGGKITVESTPDEGSTFILTLSLEEAPDNTGTILSNLDISGLENKRALIVDDTALNRRCFQTQLEDYGMIADTAESADEALHYLDTIEHTPDILIIDHLMPGTDGLALIKSIRARDDMRDIPIIFASSSIAPKSTYENAGHDAFISKPVIQKRLLEKLNTLLGLGVSQSDTLTTQKTSAA
ncbi:MAG: hypothetical protein COA69_00060 [Robiginitomaculum sp.]|nr:MAG: hypothetical protein COA69_00060 [Robiginitomaculum sp.]